LKKSSFVRFKDVEVYVSVSHDIQPKKRLLNVKAALVKNPMIDYIKFEGKNPVLINITKEVSIIIVEFKEPDLKNRY